MVIEDFKVQISTNISEILPLWSEFEANGAMTPFQAQAWLRPLFDTLAKDHKAEPFFLTIRDSDNCPLLVVPLCRRRHLGVRIVHFPDFGVSDYNAPLISRKRPLQKGQALALSAAIKNALRKVDMLRLDKMPDSVDGIPNPLINLNGVRPVATQHWGFNLPETMAEYDRMLVSTQRKELHRKRRRTEGKGTVTFVQAKTTQEKLELFDILVRQRQERCDEMGRFHLLSDRRFRDFYEAVIQRDDTHDFIALHSLRVNDQIVGTTLTLRNAHSRLLIMSTFESGAWKSCSLGNVLIYLSITDSVARGDTYFDLTIGDEGYKKGFGALPKPLFALSQSVTVLGLPHATIRSGLIELRKRLPSKAA